MGVGTEGAPQQDHQQQHHRRTHEKSDRVTTSDVRKSSLLRTQGFIKGEWVDSHTGETFAVTNPATQEDITQIAAMDKTDVERAISAATQAQHEWKRKSPLERAEALKRWHQQVVAHVDDLAMLATAESGKPLTQARGEVLFAASFIEFFAGVCVSSGGFVVPSTTSNERTLAVHEPVGVCAIITPWNFPLAMITRKLAPCLAAGCTAVLRPAGLTPLSALALVRLAELAELPAGVINVVVSAHGKSHEVGEALATSEQIRKLSFTGSTRVGKLLMEQSASNIKRLSLELGGNAPFIVFDDADLDAAVDGLMATKFLNTGQVCVSSNRIFVHASIFDKFREKVTAQVQQLQMGSPFAKETQLGPLINDKTFDKVQSLVEDAVAKGATVVTGGKRATAHGELFFEPTVLVDVNETMDVYRDEIFGPVVCMFPFDTEDEVISKANDTTAGLASYFYTRDLARAWRVSAALEYGMVGVNTGAIANAQAPFGGIKQSGVGREGSLLGLEEYVETKLINMGGLPA